MKFSHEYANEDQARSREQALKSLGYVAWCTHKPDGLWQVFWMPKPYSASLKLAA